MPRDARTADAPARRRLFFWLVTVGTPMVFLVLLEGILALTHYGPDLSLFKDIDSGGKRFLVMNPTVSARYFFRSDFSPGGSSDLFLKDKPAGGLRIFCLGASTTVGYPYGYNAAFPSFLRQRLCMLFPDRTVEVVNLGITATNSFTSLDILRELAPYHPDAVVLYDGHNEYYGALGVASHESLGSSRWLIQLSLRLVHLRTFLLLRDVYGALTGSHRQSADENQRATMMERMAANHTVRLGSDQYWQGVQAFRMNIADACAYCREYRIPFLVCTQASNMRDRPPFQSASREGLSERSRAAMAISLGLADTLRDRGEVVGAARLYQSILMVDTTIAAAQYGLAQCLERKGDFNGAWSHFLAARDNDPVRFRASEDINGILRSVPAPAIPVDIEAAFRQYSPHGLPGSDLFLEHLHPTAYGQFLIAKSIVEGFQRQGVLASHKEWIRRDTLADSLLWHLRYLTPLDERIAGRKTEILTSGWPFRQSTVPVSDIAKDDTLGLMTEMVTRGLWSWRQAHEAAAVARRARGDAEGATAESRVIAWMYPMDAAANRMWGADLVTAGRFGEAVGPLKMAEQIHPEAETMKLLGDCAARSPVPREAADWYRKALKAGLAVNEQHETRISLARVYLTLGMNRECVEELSLVLKTEPKNAAANELLRRAAMSH